MAKRRLSKNQSRRIQQNQRDSLARSAAPDTELDEKDAGPEQIGRVIAHFGTQVDIETPDYAVRRCFLRANLQSVVTGDNIVWRDRPDMGVVVSCEPRRSLLCRPDIYGKLKPVAANVDQIMVTVAPLPELHTNLIDRYLVVAECSGIRPIILLNKADLIDKENQRSLNTVIDRYRSLGYQVIVTSAKEGTRLDELTRALRDKTSVFVGQSGVGKSSLIQRLVPEQEIQIGELSEAKTKGRHTTTHSQLFHFAEGGECIDSPGIREFGLWQFTREDVMRGFIELNELSHTCKFRDCHHEHEPGCAILAALSSGKISPERFENFKRIIAGLDDVSVRGLNS